jgi:aspartyl-tRNA(Asn)/glutamyl-tRNA(Gln) amidotransferase subunit B
MPEGPEAKAARWVSRGLTAQDAAVLTAHPGVAAFFEAVLALHGDAKDAANFVQTEVLRDTELDGFDARFPATAERVAAILGMVRDGTISGKIAKEVYADVVATDREPREIVEAKGLGQVSDAALIEATVRDVVAAAPEQAAQYRAGKTKLLGFFVGEVMKRTRGRANPEVVHRVLARVLAG